ncbi:ABC transporter permease subunit [Micromonospora sp. M12]
MGVLIAVFAIFGWTSTARLVRGQVIALREREFVEAARASGAGLGHMLFRQLLPNIWAPILVSFSWRCRSSSPARPRSRSSASASATRRRASAG